MSPEEARAALPAIAAEIRRARDGLEALYARRKEAAHVLLAAGEPLAAVARLAEVSATAIGLGAGRYQGSNGS